MAQDKVLKLKRELEILKSKEDEILEIERLKNEISKTKAKINPINRFIKKVQGVINGNK